MTRAEEIAKGILLVLKYQPTADTWAEHDMLGCGHPCAMTADDLADMTGWGWFVNEENQSWAHWT